MGTFSLTMPRPPTTALFPYTTLFRSHQWAAAITGGRSRPQQPVEAGEVITGQGGNPEQLRGPLVPLTELGQQLARQLDDRRGGPLQAVSGPAGALDRKSTRLNSSHAA